MSSEVPKQGVEALMARLKAQAAERQRAPDTEPLETGAVDAQLAVAAERNVPPRVWPHAFMFFPFKDPSVQRFVLAVIARLTQTQREVDTALIGAVREHVALARAQHDRIVELERRVRELESRVR